MVSVAVLLGEVNIMEKISIREIEKVYAMCNANPNRPLNTVLNKGNLNSNFKCGYVTIKNKQCIQLTPKK